MEKVSFFPMTTSHDQRDDDDLLVYTINVPNSTTEFLITTNVEQSSEPARLLVIHVYSR